MRKLGRQSSGQPGAVDRLADRGRQFRDALDCGVEVGDGVDEATIGRAHERRHLGGAFLHQSSRRQQRVAVQVGRVVAVLEEAQPRLGVDPSRSDRRGDGVDEAEHSGALARQHVLDQRTHARRRAADLDPGGVDAGGGGEGREHLERRVNRMAGDSATLQILGRLHRAGGVNRNRQRRRVEGHVDGDRRVGRPGRHQRHQRIQIAVTEVEALGADPGDDRRGAITFDEVDVEAGIREVAAVAGQEENACGPEMFEFSRRR